MGIGKRVMLLLGLVLVGGSSMAQQTEEKELYIPANVYRVPDSNDYNDDNSEFSYHRMVETPNFAAFWSKQYGDDPMANPNPALRFNLKEALAEAERFYDFFIDTLHFAERGNSSTDKYKILVYVIASEDGGGTAFGGGDENVGMFWAPPGRINTMPYGTLAHELGHSFQYLLRADGSVGARGPMGEMTSQYMLWQVYPEWMTFENYHLVDFMKQTHLAFLHGANTYHSPYVLEYWSGLHGKDFVSRLWREAMEGEDAVTTYKRLNNLNQAQFNAEMFDASRRFITWDMDRIRDVAAPYANQHYTFLNEAGDGWYRIDTEKCPQNYGYNGIQLEVPQAGTKVELHFKGLAGTEGYTSYQADKAGWRYGFVAYTHAGKRIYGDMASDADGTITFEVPKDTQYLWLVVMGAPTEHWAIPGRRRGQQQSDEAPKEEQWPYQIKLSGTTVSTAMIR